MTLPTPYAEGRDWVLYHGDCLDILPRLDAGSVDAVVTDPPYGISYASGWAARPKIANDDDTEARDLMLRLWDGPAIVFGRWDQPRPAATRCRLIWNKGDWPGMGDLSFPWGPSDEEVYVIGAGFTGRRSGTVITQNRITNGTHPNEKPVGLLCDLIEKTPGKRILDPFTGSGTTGVACIRTGRKFIGIEIDEHYCEVAARRMREAEADQALFTQDEPKPKQMTLEGAT